jgi:hypothetical protein
MMKHKASVMILPHCAIASPEVLNSVLGTQNPFDIAEAMLTAVAASAITIL